jgi:hypothetical protein
MERTHQATRPESPAAWWTSGQDAQVFVDDSGRRARGVRAAGVVAAAVCTFWLAGLTVGMAGFSGFPTIGLHPLAHAGLTRSATLPADAIADRSQIGLRRVASAAARGRVTTAESRTPESRTQGSSCSAPPAVLSAGRLQGRQRSRGSVSPRVQASIRHALAARSSCLTAVATGSRRGVSRLT